LLVTISNVILCSWPDCSLQGRR